ncbi:MAG: hypothetical protein J3Q66DRAFT_330175 [Benniella sp.]|nr:MAG: hypothetical protein J3Q66DRAFT_330175 [Benniella sp.]
MKSLAVIAFAALASVVSAQTPSPNQLSYGEPVAATVWKVGPTANNQVKLNNDCSKATTGFTYPVHLQIQVGGYQQGYPDKNSPLVLGTINCQTKSNLKVTIPDTVPSGDQYSILIKVGDALSYSALFKIDNPKIPAGNNTTPPAASSPAATKPAATSPVSSKPPAATTTSPSGSGADALKVGSTLALAVVAAAGLLL